MAEQRELAQELLMTIMIVSDDLSFMPILNDLVHPNDPFFIAQTDIWLEFYLSSSKGTNCYQKQKREISNFVKLLNKGINLSMVDVQYLSYLRQLAKKSGRLIEFVHLVHYLSKHGWVNIWETNEIVFNIIFNALQQPETRFNHNDYNDLLILMRYKICLLTVEQANKLKHFGDLNHKCHFLKLFNNYYQLFIRDLNLFTCQDPDISPEPARKRFRKE